MTLTGSHMWPASVSGAVQQNGMSKCESCRYTGAVSSNKRIFGPHPPHVWSERTLSRSPHGTRGTRGIRLCRPRTPFLWGHEPRAVDLRSGVHTLTPFLVRPLLSKVDPRQLGNRDYLAADHGGRDRRGSVAATRGFLFGSKSCKFPLTTTNAMPRLLLWDPALTCPPSLFP